MSGGGGVDARTRARAVAAHKVAQWLLVPDFRNSVPDTNAEGSHVVIPALPDDTMDEFFAQARAAKGTIYIAMLEHDDLTVVGLSPLRHARHAALLPEDD